MSAAGLVGIAAGACLLALLPSRRCGAMLIVGALAIAFASGLAARPTLAGETP